MWNHRETNQHHLLHPPNSKESVVKTNSIQTWHKRNDLSESCSKKHGHFRRYIDHSIFKYFQVIDIQSPWEYLVLEIHKNNTLCSKWDKLPLNYQPQLVSRISSIKPYLRWFGGMPTWWPLAALSHLTRSHGPTTIGRMLSGEVWLGCQRDEVLVQGDQDWNNGKYVRGVRWAPTSYK